MHIRELDYSTAENIAERFQWDYEGWFDADGIEILDIVNHQCATREFHSGAGGCDTVRYQFPDGSAIIVGSDYWGVGYDADELTDEVQAEFDACENEATQREGGYPQFPIAFVIRYSF